MGRVDGDTDRLHGKQDSLAVCTDGPKAYIIKSLNALLFTNYLTLLMLCTPFAVLARQHGGSDSVIFTFSLLAIALLPIGTQRLQVGSFLFTAALTLTLACLWLTLSANRMLQLFLYATLYGSFWVSKITTYVLPSEVYRVEVRARRTPP